MNKHAVLSASGAHRWINCPPSAQLEQQFPEQTSSYAEEGTFAHKLAEIELRRALGERVRRPAGYKESEYYTEAMEEHLAEYVSRVMEQVNLHRQHTPDPVILFEQRLDFSRWVPGGFGTGDVVIISDLAIEVIDFKYGQGVPVTAEGNPQLRLYGLGALAAYEALYDVNTIATTVIQPRLDSIPTEVLSTKELLQWAEEVVRPAAQLAIAGRGDYKPGEHCRFCRARQTCRVRAEKNLELAKYDFQPGALLELDEIGDILQQAAALQAWVSDISAYALDQAVNHGVRFNGWKLVEGRSNRKYIDESAVASTLTGAGYAEEQIYEKLLLGITKMEKLLGKKRFAELLSELVVKPAGKPVLALESDPRPEINSTAAAAADFGESA